MWEQPQRPSFAQDFSNIVPIHTLIATAAAPKLWELSPHSGPLLSWTCCLSCSGLLQLPSNLLAVLGFKCPGDICPESHYLHLSLVFNCFPRHPACSLTWSKFSPLLDFLRTSVSFPPGGVLLLRGRGAPALHSRPFVSVSALPQHYRRGFVSAGASLLSISFPFLSPSAPCVFFKPL